MNGIVDELFPDHLERAAVSYNVHIRYFNVEEVTIATISLRSGNASFQMKIAVMTCPEVLLEMYNDSLRTNVFSSQWNTARLVLINKEKAGASRISSFRPLCMLEKAGKVCSKWWKRLSWYRWYTIIRVRSFSLSLSTLGTL